VTSSDQTSQTTRPARIGRHHTSSPSQTESLGAELALALRPGDAVLLEGELGTGKTTFVRGACRALRVSGPITSPTFTIGHRYPGSPPVAHVDLFRLDHLDGEDSELLADYLGPDAIAFVEWPRDLDALRGYAQIAARVRLTHAGDDRRIVTIEMQ
jgi:tRNA threonylcarbamoyladenosine biosynthesis protein TsaE